MSDVICKAVSRKVFTGSIPPMWQFVKVYEQDGQWKGETLGESKAYYSTAEAACDAYRDYLEDNDMHKSPDWLDFYERRGENVKVKLGQENN